jgi:regulatory protein
MRQPRKRQPGTKRPKKPLNAARLNELALAYVARFATSAGKLEDYLRRKLRERGFEGQDEGAEPPDIGAIITRFVERGYVDDHGYAKARASGLLGRGYGPRRINQSLMQAGISEDVREDIAAGTAEKRSAAVHMARKRRFGPFDRAAAVEDDAEDLDDTSGASSFEARSEARKRFEKQLAAFVRAGHDFADAQFVLAARTENELERWIAEAAEEDGFL